ncbi:MAG: hypothetical protein HXY48_03445 [Ignavibacteriaceae bacterium]|nr:hypothetical protein [Ignavibacteriaceae bacterium]
MNNKILARGIFPIILNIFLFNNIIFPQVVIKEKVEITPTARTTDRLMAEGDGWWIGGCYIENYDSSAIDLRFTPSSIEPGETANMTLWVNASPPYEYDEEDDNFLERNIILEPNLGSISRIGNGVYKYFTPSSTPGDSALVVKVNYEQFTWHCAGFDGGKTDTSYTNNVLEELQCGCPIWLLTQVWRDYGTDSIMIAWDSLDVKVVPDTIYPGDTAQVVIKKRLPDGTLVDFDSTQTYEAGMLDGCILGKLVAGNQEGAYIVDVLQPIYFIADTSADSTGTVLLRVGLIDPVDKQNNKGDQQVEFLEIDCFFGWQSESYDDVSVVKDNPLEIMYPTADTTEWISAEPQMPAVICKAKLKNYNKGSVTFEWEYWIRYTLYRHEFYTADTLCRRTGMVKISGTSNANNSDTTFWTVPFNIANLDSAEFKGKHYSQEGGCDAIINEWYEGDSIFTGGYVFIQVTAKNNSGQIIGFKQQDGGKILGTNPDPQSVKDYANPIDYKAIVYHESAIQGVKFQHFNTKDNDLYYKSFHGWLYGWKYNKKGYPTYGVPNGFGLAKIDNSPSPTEMDLWHWKHNLETGKDRFDTAKNTSMDYILNRGAYYLEDKFLMNAYQNYNSNERYWNWNRWNGSIMRLWNYHGKVGWVENSRRANNYGKTVYQIYLQLNNK